MVSNGTIPGEVPNARARFAWFARAATIGGWVLIILPLVFSPVLLTQAGGGVCGTGLAIALLGAFVVHTGCQGIAVILSSTALCLPKVGQDGKPRLWLIVAAASLAACLGVIFM